MIIRKYNLYREIVTLMLITKSIQLTDFTELWVDCIVKQDLKLANNLNMLCFLWSFIFHLIIMNTVFHVWIFLEKINFMIEFCPSLFINYWIIAVFVILMAWIIFKLLS